MSANTDSKTTVPARKGVQVHATIPADLFDKLEDHRWSVRLDMVSLVKLALTQYAKREGLLTEAAEPAKAPAKA
jgi:hypothetical protein